MATYMDIEMDIDMGSTEQDLEGQDIDIVPEHAQAQQDTNGTAPNDSSAPDALQPAPSKVHLRGLDSLTTNDLKSFASEYFSASKPTIEWIDDTSANLVYETSEVASKALTAFAAVEVIDASQIPLPQTIPAKPFPLHPHTNIEVRLSVLGDRKQPRAAERSRFYLMHPEYDPAERRKREAPKGGKRYRDRHDGGYRSRRSDERAQRKRQLDNEDAGFTANIYDDDEAALDARRKQGRQGSASSSSLDGMGDRRVGYRGAAGKELFPEREGSNSGRLRDRSASPVRSSAADREMDDAQSRRRDTAASANRQKAQMIKAQLRENTASRELFPDKTTSHRRSGAFDAADSTADLFARQMPVPFMDGSTDRRPSTDLPLTSRVTSKTDVGSARLSIRGAAKTSAIYGFNIKGAAGGRKVKELFPDGGNAGKELFSERLEGRGLRRQKAEDLFS